MGVTEIRALTINPLYVVNHEIHALSFSLSGTSADQPQLITTAFEEGVENTGYFLSSWSVSIYESLGLRHRKG